jgi:Gluconate 2-dehydrogenase subunit 3
MATRREMLQALVASVGAGAVVPGLAAQDHFGRHLAGPGAIEQADARAKAAAYKPEFLDQHQFATVASLAERIVPGASRAKTTEFIDQLLAVDARDSQRAFLTALGALEGQALARASRPWIQLADADQIAILTSASTLASGRPAARTWTKGDPIGIGREPAPPAPLTLRDHFDLLKSWVAGAYYSSEIGMKELGWTGNVVFPAFPGCEHPGGHA